MLSQEQCWQQRAGASPAAGPGAVAQPQEVGARGWRAGPWGQQEREQEQGDECWKHSLYSEGRAIHRLVSRAGAGSGSAGGRMTGTCRSTAAPLHPYRHGRTPCGHPPLLRHLPLPHPHPPLAPTGSPPSPGEEHPAASGCPKPPPARLSLRCSALLAEKRKLCTAHKVGNGTPPCPGAGGGAGKAVGALSDPLPSRPQPWQHRAGLWEQREDDGASPSWGQSPEAP